MQKFIRPASCRLRLAIHWWLNKNSKHIPASTLYSSNGQIPLLGSFSMTATSSGWQNTWTDGRIFTGRNCQFPTCSFNFLIDWHWAGGGRWDTISLETGQNSLSVCTPRCFASCGVLAEKKGLMPLNVYTAFRRVKCLGENALYWPE